MRIPFFFALLLSNPILSQSEKGVTPVNPQSAIRNPQSTRAVVVGISDYQHNAIPDLHYAHRDAEKFVQWLQSKAGGSVPADNIRLLTNENATLGKFAMALDGLIDDCRPGDQVIVYFSGHADVERKTISQPGYLLCRDAPATCYMSGGAFNLRDLQEVISTLSLQKNARVLVITDACHAGKLAGNAVGGTQITGQNLSVQFANELKIMSCQPDEYSLEGPQWDEGRGVFSYYLLDGLSGLADRDGNGRVSLFEIGRYLEDAVSAETAPHPQLPQVSGDKQSVLAYVDAPTLAQLLDTKKSGSNTLGQVGMKGPEDEVLALADSAERRQYAAFREAVAKGNLIDAGPGAHPADYYYTRLMQNEKFKPLAGLMTRNFAAALIDEVQQAINALLDNDPYENNNWQYHPEKYSRYPDYLRRAIELLGERHYLYRSLMSKKRYFEGYSVAKTLAALEKEPARRDSLREAAKTLYREAIGFKPDAAYLYHAIGDMYFAENPYQTDSVLLWCGKAAELSPGWIAPLLRIHDELVSGQGDFNQGEAWLLRALRIQPDAYLIRDRLGILRVYQNRRDEAFAIAEKMIAEKPELFNAYTIMVLLHYFLDGDFPATAAYAQKSAARNPSSNNWALNWWAGCQRFLHPLPEALDSLRHSMEGCTGIQRGYRGAFLVEALGMAKQFNEAERLAYQLLDENLPPFIQSFVLQRLGTMRLNQGRLADAEACFQKSLAADPTPDPVFILDYAWLGETARMRDQPAKAEQFFGKSLAYGSGFCDDFGFKEEAAYLYGHFLLRQNRLTEAESAFRQSLDMRLKGFWGEYGLALLAARQGKKTEALDWLEKSLDNHFADPGLILAEPLFKKIRKTERFKTMMAKRFPETAPLKN